MIESGVNEFLTSGGSKYFGFTEMNAKIKGTVVSAVQRQQTDMATGEPVFYKDSGKPAMMTVITLATEERDPSDPADDGLRDIYVRANMKTAIADALKEAKASLEEGGTLAVQYVANGTASKPGFNPPKLYAAAYKPPSKTVDSSGLLGETGGDTGPQVPAGVAAPAASSQPTASDLLD